MNEEKFLSIREICDLLNRTRVAVYKVMARYPDFPKPVCRRERGGRMYFDRQEVVVWYESHKEELDYQLRFKKHGVKDE